MLIQGLQGTQGCMLVDNGRFQSGKNAIFAWFENREAVLRWYHSEAHRTAMSMVFGPEAKPREHALQGVPDDYNGPILAIAAITYATPEQRQASGRLFTQISIELYAPLKGGLHIGGTLGPAGMKLPGGRDASGEYAVPPIAKPAGQ
ncbi:MAG TPA: hypothetical protein DEB06_03065 [Phycisphaerales bacterium]|nr:hypothetical protein [Phycisphaerales bacterium]